MELEKFGLDIPSKGKEGIFIVDIYTDWCAPCKALSPILEKFQEEGLISLIEVDLDSNPSLGAYFKITGIPTLLIFKEGTLFEGELFLDGQEIKVRPEDKIGTEASLKEATVVKDGKLIGAAPERILREIIQKIK